MTPAALDALMTDGERRIGEAYARAVGYLRQANPPALIARHLAEGWVGVPLIGLRDAMAQVLDVTDEFHREVMRATAAGLSDALGRPVSSAYTAAIAERMERERADVIDAFEREQEDLAREVRDTAERAQLTRTDVGIAVWLALGLTRARWLWLWSYRLLLVGGDYADAVDRTLSGAELTAALAAFVDDAALDRTQLDALIAAYAAAVLANRVKTLAERESQAIIHEAQDDVWGRLVDAGVIAADEVMQEWLTMRDRRVRFSHRPMQGQRRRWGELFDSGAGNRLRYPGDAAAPLSDTEGCRCLRRYFIGRARFSQM